MDTPGDQPGRQHFDHGNLHLLVEKDFNQNVIEQLKAMGYKIRMTGAIGRTEVIMVRDKKITAVADHRGDDGAAGY